MFRYQSLRRTIRSGGRSREPIAVEILPAPIGSSSEPAAVVSPAESEPATNTDQDAPLPNSSSTPPRITTLERRERGAVITEVPGCKFLRRRDFFQYVNNHGVSTCAEFVVNRERKSDTYLFCDTCSFYIMRKTDDRYLKVLFF